MISNIRLEGVEARIIERKAIASFDTNVKVQPVKFGKDFISFIFSWEVNYSPKVAFMKYGGTIVVADKPEKIRQISDEWQKSKTVSKELVQEMTNGINYYCTMNAPLVDKSLDIIPPIAVPVLNMGKQK